MFQKSCLVVCLALPLGACWSASGSTPSEQRDSIHEMRSAALEKLYELDPNARDHVEGAVGYAVFSNFNVHAIIFGGKSGYGVLADTTKDSDTYMKVRVFGLGPGITVREYTIVVVFKSEAAMEQFVNSGWEFDAHVDMEFIFSGSGWEWGAETFGGPDVRVFQFTNSGVGIQAFIAGAHFRLDDELNK